MPKDKRCLYQALRCRAGLTILLVCFVLAAGCRSFSPITPAMPGTENEIDRQFRQFFSDRPWVLIQAVTAFIPDGGIQNAFGITRIYPREKRVKCVITSLQGITLLDAEKCNGQVSISRAVPPFDDKTFAGTMFDDMRLIFWKPEGRLIGTGHSPSGEPVCRYALTDKRFVDLMINKDAQIEIRAYSRLKKHIKTIISCYNHGCSRYLSETPEGVPAKITIYHHDLIKYRLELELIRAEALTTD